MFVPWVYLIIGGVLAVIGAITVVVLLVQSGLGDVIGDILD